jgi:hypothetical protein
MEIIKAQTLLRDRFALQPIKTLAALARLRESDPNNDDD